MRFNTTPVTVTPSDIQPLIEKLMTAYDTGYLGSQNIQKAGEVGTSDAQAAKAKNEAAEASSNQDRLDAQGETGQASVFSRLFGKKPAGATAPAAPAAPTPHADISSASTEALLDAVKGAGFSIFQ